MKQLSPKTIEECVGHIDFSAAVGTDEDLKRISRLRRSLFGLWNRYQKLHPELEMNDVLSLEMQVLLEELAANAIIHGQPGTVSSVNVVVKFDSFVMKTSNVCDGSPCEEILDPSRLEEGKRGRFIVNAVRDDLTDHLSPRGFAIELYEKPAGQAYGQWQTSLRIERSV